MSTDASKKLLGIDIGGTKVVLAVANASGEVGREVRIDRWTSGNASHDIKRLIDESQRLLSEAQVPLDNLARVGISAPGPLDSKRGLILSSPNLPGWSNVPIVEEFQKALGATTLLENDANAAALAEWRYGAGRGADSIVYLTMSTGIGGGIIVDGHLVRGSHSQGGEVGHIPIVPGGRRCGCGKLGCLEAYTGGLAIANRIRDDLAKGHQTSIMQRAGGNPQVISAAHWCEALKDEDAYALQLRDEFLGALTQGIAILIGTLDPQRLILGTIIQRNPDLFLDELKERVREATDQATHACELLLAELGPKLPAHAAIAVASLDDANESL